MGNIIEGIRLYKLQHWDAAREEFLNLPEEEPGEGTERAYYLGLCCAKLKRYEEALDYLEQVVTGGQDLERICQCRMTLAYIYAITDRCRMAEFEIQRLLGSGFISTQLYNTLAYTSWKQQRFQDAVNQYAQVLTMDGENPTALNGLGYVLADSGLDPLQGIRYCRRAVELKPRSPAYLDSLGWAYYKQGNREEARNWLYRALEADSQHPEIQEHLRIVLEEGTE